MSKFGLGCDNVLTAEIALADGRIVEAGPRKHPDLFWAIRGGGGNYGVVTSFTVALHDVQKVSAGDFTYSSDNVADLLRVLREAADMNLDEVTIIAFLERARSGKFQLTIQACYVGDSASNPQAFTAFRHSPLLESDTARPMRYIELVSQVPDNLPPVFDESRAGFVSQINEDIVSMFAQALATAPPRYVITFVRLNGAVTQIAAASTAFPLRTRGFAIGVTSSWKKPENRKQSQEWVASVGDRLRKLGSGAYVHVMDIEADASVRAAYGENYQRLSAVKAAYDPSNLFSINQNIKPTRLQ